MEILWRVGFAVVWATVEIGRCSTSRPVLGTVHQLTAPLALERSVRSTKWYNLRFVDWHFV